VRFWDHSSVHSRVYLFWPYALRHFFSNSVTVIKKKGAYNIFLFSSRLVRHGVTHTHDIRSALANNTGWRVTLLWGLRVPLPSRRQPIRKRESLIQGSLGVPHTNCVRDRAFHQSNPWPPTPSEIAVHETCSWKFWSRRHYDECVQSQYLPYLGGGEGSAQHTLFTRFCTRIFSRSFCTLFLRVFIQ